MERVGLWEPEGSTRTGTTGSTSYRYWDCGYPAIHGKAGWFGHYEVQPFFVSGWPQRESSADTIAQLHDPQVAFLPRDIQRHIEAWYHGKQKARERWSARPTPQDQLCQLVQEFERARLHDAFDIAAIADQAKHSALACWRFRDVERMERYCWELGIEPPDEDREPKARALRMLDPKWWRRRIRVDWTRKGEEKMRELQMVRRGRQLYVSDRALAWYLGRQQQTESWLKSNCLISSAGVQLELWDVHQSSISNKTLRRTELMTRMRGFEDHADQKLDDALFFTLTAPSAFHPCLASGGPNPRYRGATVRESQAWLSKMWGRARAILARRRISIYGFRVAEPHHDGTPHWHMVLFCAPSAVGQVRAVLESKWLSEYGDEPGAASHRIECLAIDRTKGSATGYIGKYIAKNIDAYSVEEDTSDEDLSTALENAVARVTAWAAVHGIRQFQQIGGPPVGPYRELRRVREPEMEQGKLFDCWRAADTGKWGEYIEAYGGVDLGRFGHVQPLKDQTGEIGQYNEVKPPAVVGVMSRDDAVFTRMESWRVQRKAQSGAVVKPRDSLERTSGLASFRSGSSLGPVTITVTGGPGSNEPTGWSNPNETSTYGPN